MIDAEQGRHFLLRDEPQCLLLPDRGIALMVDLDHLDLGAAEIGETGGLGEGQSFEFGMGVVDDVDREFDRRLRRLSRRRGIAGERIEGADLDRIRRLRRRGDEHARHGRDDRARKSLHVILLPLDGCYFQPFIGHSILAVADFPGQTALYSLPWSWMRYVAASVFCPVSSNLTPR